MAAENATRAYCTACLLALGARWHPPGASDQQPLVDYVRVINIIGEGPRAQVFLAQWTTPEGALVALKRATAAVSEPPHDNRLIEVDHPNIATIFEMGTDNRARHYVLCEYVPGVPITRYSQTHGLSLPDRLHLWAAAADALTYAHALGIVHGNMKPSNLLVAGGGVKILDFHQIFGCSPTPSRYRAPEQAFSSIPDARSDIYAMGVILRELVEASADPGLQAAVAHATTRDPGERFQTLEEFLNAM